MSLLIWLLHTAPRSCPIGQVITPCLARCKPSLSERLQYQQEQVVGSISDIIYLAILCTVEKYLLKAMERCQRQPLLLSRPLHLTCWKFRLPKGKLELLCQPVNKTPIFQCFRGLSSELGTVPAFTTWSLELSKVCNESQTSSLLRGRSANHREVTFISFSWIIISPKTCRESFMASWSLSTYQRLFCYMWGTLLLVCANEIHTMTCFAISPSKQNPEICKEGGCLWWWFANTAEKLHLHTPGCP